MPIKTTSRQDREFGDLLKQELNFSGLDASFAIDWVLSNFSLDELFSRQDLETWALENGFVKAE